MNTFIGNESKRITIPSQMAGGKNRVSNLELVRILSMLFIVANHYVWHGGSAVTGTNITIAYLFGNYAQIGVALFVMVGSWFLVEKKFSINRPFNLWKQLVFYSFTFTLLVKVLFPEKSSLYQLVTCFFPVIFSKYWFVVPYLFLLFLHPFINHILSFCTKQQIRGIIVFLL